MIRAVCLPCPWFYMPFLKKNFNPLCSSKRCLNIPYNDFVIIKSVWIEKLSRISMYIAALIINVMIAISTGPLHDMQLHIMNYLGNWLVFFQLSSLCFIWTTPDKSFNIIVFTNSNYWFLIEYHFHHDFSF